MKEVYVYDLETYPNMFLAVFKNINTGEFKVFEISDRKNQLLELKVFLYNEVKGLIGFNNVNFDYPVLHHTILDKNKNFITSYDIYKEVERIIASKYSSIWDNQTIIPQLDLFKIWHYDNKNKSTSLKWLEFALRWSNLEELPYEVGTILNNEQMDHVIEYCYNDINATEQFYNKSKKHISIREFYSKQEGVNMMNASEIRMSKTIFGKYLAKEMGIDIKTLNQLRTNRNSVNINDVIFDYIKFNDPINQKTLDIFNNSIWLKERDEEDGIKFKVNYKNVVRDYAEGGLHSFGEAGIYESDDEWVLCDLDFASYYPHISFRNKLHPEHIPEQTFSKIYEGFYKDRKLYSKKDPRNYVLKIILNGSYGLSKDQFSFLYDPKWQLAICINGQLMLTMLTEKVFEYCNYEPLIIFENTDGAMYKIHRSDIDNLNKACKEIEEIVNIPLEIQECQKIIAKDVNNYVNIISENNIKFKGAFEIDRDYHKNHSKRVVPLALAEYFINNKPVEDTILNFLKTNHVNVIKEWDYDNNQPIYYTHHGIYDFCIGAKMKGDNKLHKRTIVGVDVIDEPIGKINRYYISNKGHELIKKLPPLEKDFLTETDKYKIKVDSTQLNIFDFIEDDVTLDASDREENLEAGSLCTLFNKFEEYDYDINYNYYINECNKIINTINSNKNEQ